jgi:hypothetical protein
MEKGEKVEAPIAPATKEFQFKQFIAPLLMGLICGAALLVGEVLILPSVDYKLTWFLALTVPIVLFICVTSVVGAGLLLIVSLSMLLFKSKRSLAIQLIISALCTGIPIVGALAVSQETLISKLVKNLPVVDNQSQEPNNK